MQNRYNHKNLRVRKIVRRYTEGEWTDYATHDFTYDGGNIVLERIAFADGSTRTVEYFWGNDLSGTEQGAGGVGGLVAVSIDGSFYIPCYDHNGNVVCYVSESGTIAAQYVYDPYGNVIEVVGPNVDLFFFGFSTKYHDREVDLVGYQYRHLSPPLGRWLNRDPIEDEGGENLYVFCCNSPQWYFDVQGHLPSLGWGTVVAPNGRFNDALGDFLDGGSSKTYLYVYPDSASTRLLGHPELQRVMSEFRAVKCGVSRDIPGSVNFKAGVLQFIRDAWTYFGVYDFVGRLNPINAQAQDIGYEILGSFKGQYNISLDCANCSRTLYMTIENSITVASGTRIPGTKYSLMTYPLLNPVHMQFIYLIQEPIK